MMQFEINDMFFARTLETHLSHSMLWILYSSAQEVSDHVHFLSSSNACQN